MALSSSLFTGTSGLKNMGNSMQIIGNNTSNVNTVGFKKGSSTFADTLYESVATRAGSDQMGRGMAVGDVSKDFSQGSFESTGNTTDLSIGGDGFFIVRQQQTERNFYTKAGNFNFDKSGQLVNPEGYIVQGWNLDEETGEDVGAIGDLVLDEFSSAPEKSTKLTSITNLDADAESKSTVLSNSWDGSDQDGNYIAGTNYEYQTVVKAYDSLGSTHDISIYYDKKSDTDWEYMVTSNPSEDKRNLVQETASKGLLARGTIEFSQSSGDILDFTMSELTGRLGNFQANGVNTNDAINYQVLDYEKMPLDGYGFSFEFDGASWDFEDKNNDGAVTGADMPENYKSATVVYSDSQEIQLALNPDDAADTDPDIKIQLDQPAVATDSLGFDINNPKDLHVQGIEGTQYTGDTANDNTTLEINNPNVMTHDAKDLGIVWNPTTEKWHWSNPEVAETAGSLVKDVSATNGVSLQTPDPVQINQSSDLDMYAEDVRVRYNNQINNWDWYMPLKEEDLTSSFTGDFTPANEPVVSVSNDTGTPVRAIETSSDIQLHWLGSQSKWSLDSNNLVEEDTSGNMKVKINNADSSNTNAQVQLWNSSASEATASTVSYAFGSPITAAEGQSIRFSIDPTPPAEYGTGGVLSTGTTSGPSGALDSDYQLSSGVTFSGASGVNFAEGTRFASGSTLASGTTLAANSTIGAGTVLTTDFEISETNVSSGTLTSGTNLNSGTVLGADTDLQNSFTIEDVDVSGGTLESGTTLAAGSILAANTEIPGGTVMSGGSTGTTLTADFEVSLGGLASGSVLTSETVLGSGVTMSIEDNGGTSGTVTGSGNATLAELASGAGLSPSDDQYTLVSGASLSGSTTTTLASGSEVLTPSGLTLASDVSLNSEMTLNADTELGDSMDLQAGAVSTLATGSELASDSTVNSAITLSSGGGISGGDMNLVSGTTLAAGSNLSNGSVINGEFTLLSSGTLSGEMTAAGAGVTLGSGIGFNSGITSGSYTLAAGTLLTEGSQVDSDLTVQAGPKIDFTPTGSPDTQSMQIHTANGVGGGETITFDIDPDIAPAEYSDATLKGDQTEAVIDLDGSGNEEDNRDIVFKFEDELKFGKDNTHPYNDRSEIDFDIQGSTAWTEMSRDDMTDEGYFAFTTDFLGGEFGSTETDIQLDMGTVFDGNNFKNDAMATTQYSKSSTTTFQDANGYAAGDLEEVDVSSDGMITGVYSNGELIPLFRVGLADFLNNYGLKNEGGNLFSETRDSGGAITNKPGEGGLGTISPNSLEMSNVDISEEFVNMITTQRGFQANSKTVTTTDEMMQTVINMKR